jgi:hypothetical protein
MRTGLVKNVEKHAVEPGSQWGILLNESGQDGFQNVLWLKNIYTIPLSGFSLWLTLITVLKIAIAPI